MHPLEFAELWTRSGDDLATLELHSLARLAGHGGPDEQYVGLEAGGDGVMLKQGDRLRLTQSAVVLENLISQFLFNKAAEGKDGK